MGLLRASASWLSRRLLSAQALPFGLAMRAPSRVVTALNGNQLAVFLLANLLTGAVNLSVQVGRLQICRRRTQEHNNSSRENHLTVFRNK